MKENITDEDHLSDLIITEIKNETSAIQFSFSTPNKNHAVLFDPDLQNVSNISPIDFDDHNTTKVADETYSEEYFKNIIPECLIVNENLKETRNKVNQLQELNKILENKSKELTNEKKSKEKFINELKKEKEDFKKLTEIVHKEKENNMQLRELINKAENGVDSFRKKTEDLEKEILELKSKCDKIIMLDHKAKLKVINLATVNIMTDLQIKALKEKIINLEMDRLEK